MYVVHKTFIEVLLFKDTSLAMKSSWLHTYTCQFITILAFFGWILPTKLRIRSSLNLLHFAKDALIKEFQRDLKFLVNLSFNSWNFGFRTKNHKSLNFRIKQLRICKLSTIIFCDTIKHNYKFFFPFDIVLYFTWASHKWIFISRWYVLDLTFCLHLRDVFYFTSFISPSLLRMYRTF